MYKSHGLNFVKPYDSTLTPFVKRNILLTFSILSGDMSVETFAVVQARGTRANADDNGLLRE
jgi:hypothetical protein